MSSKRDCSAVSLTRSFPLFFPAFSFCAGSNAFSSIGASAGAASSGMLDRLCPSISWSVEYAGASLEYAVASPSLPAGSLSLSEIPSSIISCSMAAFAYCCQSLIAVPTLMWPMLYLARASWPLPAWIFLAFSDALVRLRSLAAMFCCASSARFAACAGTTLLRPLHRPLLDCPPDSLVVLVDLVLEMPWLPPACRATVPRRRRSLPASPPLAGDCFELFMVVRVDGDAFEPNAACIRWPSPLKK
mmetsp:Transcript_12722/g.30168  ORF Transcript_12722/g.30168 Transcript_12722/m.30168 type:complete len:245 (-) Transcript_12722:6136-6870(-)